LVVEAGLSVSKLVSPQDAAQKLEAGHWKLAKKRALAVLRLSQQVELPERASIRASITLNKKLCFRHFTLFNVLVPWWQKLDKTIRLQGEMCLSFK